MKIAIIGATSAIAQACVKHWAQHNHTVHFFFIGRNLSALQRLAQDLKLRYPSCQITSQESDFFDPLAIQKTVNSLYEQGPLEIILIAQGSLPDQKTAENSLSKCLEALKINALSPVLFAEAFAQHLERTQTGTLALIGSVAGDRGRRSNYIYGSAKGLIDRYTQGLRHRFANTPIHILLIKPGPTDTPMTAHYKQQGIPLASTQQVAQDIAHAIETKKNELYTPARWKYIMRIIQHLPDWIFNKINF